MDHIFIFSYEIFPAVQRSDIIYDALRVISSAIFILDLELIPDRWRIKEKKNDLTKGFTSLCNFFGHLIDTSS